MSGFRDIVRTFVPFGLVDRHRRRFRLQRLGLKGGRELLSAVEACRFELWPIELRRPECPWTLVDVGANEGEFIAAAARLVRLRRVFAFEPLPSCQAKLGKVLVRIPESELMNVAVGARDGEVQINATVNSKMASVLVPCSTVADAYDRGDFDITKRITVPLITLDGVIPKDEVVGLLKVDVQGFELEVLNGARAVLERTRAVLLEVNYVQHYKGAVEIDHILAFMRIQGFHIFGVSSPYLGNDGPLWADAMFVRPS